MKLPMVSTLPPNFKECGECHKCCEGWVAGEAFGVPFRPNKPCAFHQGKCLVYSFRPDVCKKFFCGWAQGLFPDWMRPDLTNVLISIGDWSKGQYLKIILCDTSMPQNVEEEIKKFINIHKTPCMVHNNGKTDLYGQPEFIKEFTQ